MVNSGLSPRSLGVVNGGASDVLTSLGLNPELRMARPLRIEFEDAIYHVTSRGLERRDIVRDDVDRSRWVATLERVAERRRWRVLFRE